jgi:CRP-like cAMP-binding protein
MRKQIMEPTAAALSGDLSFIGLGELLQLIGTSGGTGVLTLESPHLSHTGTIYIKLGNPVDALCASKSGQDGLFALFGWIEGRFEFRPGEISRPRVIRQSRMSLILDGMRLVDEGVVPKVKSGGLFEIASRQDRQGAWVPLLKGPLTPYGDVVDEDTFPAGSYIIEEGKHGQWVYAILDGEAEVVKKTGDGQVTIMRLGPGSFTGYLSFLTNGKTRNVSVIARTKVIAGVLNTERLHMELYERSLLFTDLVQSQANRLLRMFDRFFSPIDDPNAQAIIESVSPVANALMLQSGLYRLDRGAGALTTDISGTQWLIEEIVKGDFIGKFPFGEGLETSVDEIICGTPQFSVSPVDFHHVLAEFKASSGTMQQLVGHLNCSITATGQVLHRYLQVLSKKTIKGQSAG